MRTTDLMLMTILTWSLDETATIYREVLINAPVNISCTPNETIHIQWHHTAPGASKSDYIYAGGKFYSSSNRGFRLEKDSNTGPYHLVIPNARTEDAGLYECKEDATGSRMFGSTQLTVLESNPACGSDMKPHGYVGPSTCRLEHEDMTFTCAVSFSGKPPQMIWTTLNGSLSFNESTHKIEGGRITSSLILKAESMYDGSIFICQTTNSTAKCSTEIIKIHYFEVNQPSVVKKNVGDLAICSVKSNQILQFEWTLINGDQRVFLTKEQTVLIQNLGLHRCEVSYSIENVSCKARATEVNAYNSSTAVTCSPPKAGTETITTPVIIVLVMLVVILIGVIGALLYNYLQLRRRRNGSSENQLLRITDAPESRRLNTGPQSSRAIASD